MPSEGIKCEASQAVNKIAFSEDIEGIDEWKHSWPKGEISYRLNNETADITNSRHQRRAVTIALRAWQLYIKDLKFRREYNNDTTVDFNVSFEGLDHFDGRKGVFAHAYFPGQGDISGDCHINDEWQWVTSSKLQTMGKPPLVPILIHEFGHSIGLRHDTAVREAIMYPYFDMGATKNQLHQRDITRAQTRYGKRTLSQRILNYFSNRRNQAWDFK
jgi:hypothetical protein